MPPLGHVIGAEAPVSAPKEAQVGLVAGGTAIPLRSVKVQAKILDMVAEVVLYQEYVNAQANEIEAKYVFPLDEKAAVCGFEAFIKDKHIVGKVKEKEEAHREYQQAIASGKGAYLLDEEEPDVFTCR